MHAWNVLALHTPSAVQHRSSRGIEPTGMHEMGVSRLPASCRPYHSAVDQRILRACAAVVLLTVAGCGADSGPSMPPQTTPASRIPEATQPSSAVAWPESVDIADGVVLVAGPEGKLPVKIRWVRQLAEPEQIAVDGDVI